MELHRLERMLLEGLRGRGKVSLKEAAEYSGLDGDSVARASIWMVEKRLARIEMITRTRVSLGKEGRRFAEEGMPECRLIEILRKLGGRASIDDIQKIGPFTHETVNIALGWARRKGWVEIAREENVPIVEVIHEARSGSSENELIDRLSRSPLWLDEIPSDLLSTLENLVKRPDVVLLEDKTERFIQLTEKGSTIAQTVDATEETSQVTPELIRSGEWNRTRFRKYDIKSPVASYWPGKKQPYRRFLDRLKQNLVALGFEEMEGPIVEMMFYNCDALYMPQDHPAREIHDIYFPEKPAYGELSEREQISLCKVKQAHENGWKTGSTGWGYEFRPEEARRIVLRSQGTALSARTLLRKDLKIPSKYFSISRCYRPDVVDQRHLTEFDQVEGIVVGEGLTFRDLLGVLEMFAMRVAHAEQVRFRPDYFPFTEPSVELAAYKKDFGWIEFGGAGMFRPEVTLPLDVNVPVIAWGLGVNRLYMMQSGIDDIRQLYTQDLNWLRTQKVG